MDVYDFFGELLDYKKGKIEITEIDVLNKCPPAQIRIEWNHRFVRFYSSNVEKFNDVFKFLHEGKVYEVYPNDFKIENKFIEVAYVTNVVKLTYVNCVVVNRLSYKRPNILYENSIIVKH